MDARAEQRLGRRGIWRTEQSRHREVDSRRELRRGRLLYRVWPEIILDRAEGGEKGESGIFVRRGCHVVGRARWKRLEEVVQESRVAADISNGGPGDCAVVGNKRPDAFARDCGRAYHSDAVLRGQRLVDGAGGKRGPRRRAPGTRVRRRRARDFVLREIAAVEAADGFAARLCHGEAGKFAAAVRGRRAAEGGACGRSGAAGNLGSSRLSGVRQPISTSGTLQTGRLNGITFCLRTVC